MLAMGDGEQHALYGKRKQALFADLQGTVVEIGPGTGLNLLYLPTDIHWIGVEPNAHLHKYIRAKASGKKRSIEIHAATLEALALADASVDAVISTLVLCSVADPAATLGEIRRVLKPGGRFFFIEHVIAPEGSFLRGLQRLVRPAWRLVADGCRPDRDTAKALREAGFSDVQMESFNLPIPNIVRPHIAGVAVV